MKKREKTYVYNEHDENQVEAILNKRKKAKKLRVRRILSVCLVIIAIFAYFLTGVSKINKISISGNSILSTDVIKDEMSLKEGQSYVLFNTSRSIRSDVESIKFIKKASVSKSFFGDVSIKVTETKIVAYGTVENKLYVVDNVGDMREDKDQTLLTYVQRTPKLNGFNLQQFKLFVKAYIQLPTVFTNQLSDVNFSPQKGDDDRCEFLMDNGKVIYLRIADMANQLKGDNFTKKMNQYPDYKYYDFIGKYVYVYN